MASPILYGHPESGHSYKVAMSLALMDEPYEYHWVDIFAPREQRDPEFLRMSRFGEIPVFVDDGIAYAQSDAILLHLTAKHRRLGGETPFRLAQVRELLFWEANRVGISLPNLRHAVRFAPGTHAVAVLDWLRERMDHDFTSLERALATQPYLLGNELSVADLACSAYLLYDDMNLDLQRWPAMQAWLERIRALPRWQHPHELMRSG